MAVVTFSKELEVFQSHRREWLRSEAGRFVAIQDSTVVGFFDTYGDALKAGLLRFGVNRNFLIKQVGENDPVYVVS
jgi:hypothetical protein